MNTWHGIGRLAYDPEYKTTRSGTGVVNFRMAVNRSYKKSDGSKAEETAWIDCEAWDTGGKLIAENFRKGDPIIVDGSLIQDNWEDKNTGEKRNRLKIRVERFYFVPRTKIRDADEAAPEDGQAPTSAPSASGDDDDADIPF